MTWFTLLHPAMRFNIWFTWLDYNCCCYLGTHISYIQWIQLGHVPKCCKFLTKMRWWKCH